MTDRINVNTVGNDGDDDDDEAPTARELGFRAHSLRNFKPEDFRAALQAGEDKADLRTAFERIESGRFEPMVNAAHKTYSHLDPDERREFWREYTKLMEWASIWGKLHTLRDYEDERPAGV